MHPFFCGDEHAVNEALIPAHFLPVIQLVEEGPPHVQEHVRFGPLFQSAMHGALGAVPFRQFAPGSARPENPEDALEALAVICRRATTFFASFAFREFCFD